jgi:3-oxoacyl-[acyl-carrier-protein] synthase-3
VEPGTPTSHLAVQAANRALEERGISAAEIEAIFLGTVTPDMFFPSTACLVQDRIGARGAWGFDISAACSGFVYALQTGVKFVESGAHKKVLVVGADVMSSIIDYTDRATCVIFGDGAGAVVIEPADGDEYFIDFLHEVDGSGGCALSMPGGGSLHPSTHETVDKRLHYVHQDGQAVFKYAVRKMSEASEQLLCRNGFKITDVSLFVPHQANRRIMMSCASRLGLTDDRVVCNIDEYGNTTAGTIPLALETARQQGRLKKGDLVLIAAVGAGFTTGAALFRWAF